MFSKIGYSQVYFVMTDRWSVLSTLLILIFILNGCGGPSAPQRRWLPSGGKSMQTIRFNDVKTIRLEVKGDSVSDRINALRQFMTFLDNQPNVDFSSGFEQSRVTVRCKTALDDWWQVDFHLVWPNPTMDNQQLNLVKLLNWITALEDAAPGDVREPTASVARELAVERLLGLINEFAQETDNMIGISSPVD
jgi:hypothetical protein